MKSIAEAERAENAELQWGSFVMQIVKLTRIKCLKVCLLCENVPLAACWLPSQHRDV